jgi:hypothetical protein
VSGTSLAKEGDMPDKRIRTATLILVLGSSSAPLAAQPATAFRRNVIESIALSQNNLGLQNRIEVAWRRPLSASASPLRKGAHFTAGISNALTPSYTRVAGFVEVAPLSIVEVRVGAEPSAYFGTFHSLASFDSYDDVFDRSALKARSDRSGFGTTFRAFVSPKLKLRLGSFVAVSGADFEWWTSSVEGPLFYEPERDTLLAVSGDRLVTTSSLLLRETKPSSGGTLAYGLIHNYTYVHAAPGNRIQRLGAVVIRQFPGKRFGRNAPRIAGYLSYYLDDRSKKGELCSALALAFPLGR